MSAHDVWLLDGSDSAPWDEESAPFGLCEDCDSPLVEDGCNVCAPRVGLEYTPVRASFAIDTATGAVTWAGACTEAFGLFLEEHTP